MGRVCLQRVGDSIAVGGRSGFIPYSLGLLLHISLSVSVSALQCRDDLSPLEASGLSDIINLLLLLSDFLQLNYTSLLLIGLYRYLNWAGFRHMPPFVSPLVVCVQWTDPSDNEPLRAAVRLIPEIKLSSHFLCHSVHSTPEMSAGRYILELIPDNICGWNLCWKVKCFTGLEIGDLLWLWWWGFKREWNVFFLFNWRRQYIEIPDQLWFKFSTHTHTNAPFQLLLIELTHWYNAS